MRGMGKKNISHKENMAAVRRVVEKSPVTGLLRYQKEVKTKSRGGGGGFGRTGGTGRLKLLSGHGFIDGPLFLRPYSRFNLFRNVRRTDNLLEREGLGGVKPQCSIKNEKDDFGLDQGTSLFPPHWGKTKRKQSDCQRSACCKIKGPRVFGNQSGDDKVCETVEAKTGVILLQTEIGEGGGLTTIKHQ